MPREDVSIRRAGLGAEVRLSREIRALLKNPKPVLRGIGRILQAQAVEAFERQGIQGHPWAGRYPKQADPFINIAGAVSDLAKGPNVKARRFQRRPAGVDTGQLRRSLQAQGSVKTPSKFKVEVGSTVEHAPFIQWGGTSSQAITPTVRQNLTAYLAKNRKARPRTQAGQVRIDAAQRLGFLFRRDVLETEIGQRPFLGITDQSEVDIVRLVEEFFRNLGQGQEA